MASRFVSGLIFLVRATGLVGVIAISAILIVTSATAKKPNTAAMVGGCWLIAAAALSWPRLPDAWRNDPPTQRQIDYARSLGITIPAGVSKGQLSEMISAATGR